MKVNYETDEDIAFLRTGLHFGLMITERVFDPAYHAPEYLDYFLQLVAIRRRLHEFLQEVDPNAAVLDEIVKSIA